MKKITLLAILLVTALTVSAQSTTAEADIKKMWLEVYEAYNNGNYETGFEAYTKDALEITPDGRIAMGKEALRANWQEFMKVVDEKPTFKPDHSEGSAHYSRGSYPDLDVRGQHQNERAASGWNYHQPGGFPQNQGQMVRRSGCDGTRNANDRGTPNR